MIALGHAGADVVVNYASNEEAAKKVVAEAQRCGSHAFAYRADMSREDEVQAMSGKIICMSSVHEVIPWAGHANYAASKGGVMLMMKSLAQEVAPYRIRVNSIAPGAIRTPINCQAWETPEAYEG